MGPGHVKEPPRRTYTKGKGESLFTREPIPTDWIKAKAQAGEMGSALYAVALKTPQGLKFRPPCRPISTHLPPPKTSLRQVREGLGGAEPDSVGGHTGGFTRPVSRCRSVSDHGRKCSAHASCSDSAS